MNQWNKPRYIMIGGFLGAGKTTAVIQLAKRLHQDGVRVGLISNDQSAGLVDSALMRKHGFPVEEIPGGCFCCKFNSLVEAADRLTHDAAPECFIAEPVGSCTDLIATVSYPLRRIYGENYTISPLSVMIDPIRARRVLGLDESKSFSKKVLYVYRKQLEEANYIVINKQELLSASEKLELIEALQNEFNPNEIFTCSARDQDGLQPWFERILNEELGNKEAMDLDYEEYAEGEALLGWLNATVQVNSAQEFDGNQWLESLAQQIWEQLNRQSAEIAHLKMTLTPKVNFFDIASVNVVRNDFVPELGEQLQDPLQSGILIINLRAEAASESLQQIIENALNELSAHQYDIQMEHIEHFQPAKPCPTHRMTV